MSDVPHVCWVNLTLPTVFHLGASAPCAQGQVELDLSGAGKLQIWELNTVEPTKRRENMGIYIT